MMSPASFATHSVLNLLFENNHTLVAYMDLDSNFLRVSHAYALADGHDTDFFIGKSYFDLYPSDENRKTFNHVVKTAESYFAEASSFKNIQMLDIGDTFWDWSFSPVKDEQGEISGILLQLVDVTRTVVAEKKLYEKIKNELHHYDEELEDIIESRTKLLQETVALLQDENSERIKTQTLLVSAKEDAEKANVSKSQFLSRMSHELRTPMNAILGFSQLLKMGNLDEKQESYNDEILLAGEHLLSMISDVLDLSRVESGSFSVSISDVFLSSLVEESIALVSHKLDFRNITIHNLIENDNEILLSVDKTRLKEVLINVLTNAVKYNSINGLISIGCKKIDENYVSIYVSDTGKGLSTEDQKHIFDPFNRLGAEYTDIEGVGIGLTISKKLMELMDGEISIESEKGKGSTFHITCPIGDTLNINKGNSIPITLLDEDKIYNVLYVEDNKSNQTLVKNLFSEIQNIDLKISATAEDGLSEIDNEIFDLILMDINLPDLDGYGALDKIKKNAATKHIPVVALSAAASAGDIKKGLEAGFNKYVTKPVVLNELVSIINEELNNTISH